jgi:hypothetical protein
LKYILTGSPKLSAPAAEHAIVSPAVTVKEDEHGTVKLEPVAVQVPLDGSIVIGVIPPPPPVLKVAGTYWGENHRACHKAIKAASIGIISY